MRGVVEGGRWQSDVTPSAASVTPSAARGWYRLILTTEDSGRTSRPLAVVQWLERSEPGALVTVRATAELPFRGKMEWGVGDPALGEVYGRWCASMTTVRKTFFGFKNEWLRFSLGPPGQTHPVQRC